MTKSLGATIAMIKNGVPLRRDPVMKFIRFEGTTLRFAAEIIYSAKREKWGPMIGSDTGYMQSRL